MKAGDFISSFPKKTFEAVFDERVGLTNISVDDIDSRKSHHNRIFYLDRGLLEIKSIFEKNQSIELDNYILDRLRFFIDLIQQAIAWLNKLDLTQPTNPTIVFDGFEKSLNNSKWYSRITYKVEDRQVDASVLLDSYISEFLILHDTILLRISLNTEFSAKTEKQFKEIEKIVEKIYDNKDNFNKAIDTANNWIKTESKTLATALSKRSATFDQKSNEHKCWSVWIWLVLAVGCGAFIFTEVDAIKDLLIVTNDNGDRQLIEISLGAALLRLSSFIIPGYFAIFFIQRFLVHKKLYEAYKFRHIAIETMNSLAKSYTGTSERAQILEKCLSIIFSEPHIKEDSDKALVSDMKDILKNKISG
ncbi:MAG: hypothetical protein AAB592_02825 [Patescibacteria group bacterium]